MNYVEELAKVLGVKPGVTFDVIDKSNGKSLDRGPFKLTAFGLVDVDGVMRDMALGSIVRGVFEVVAL